MRALTADAEVLSRTGIRHLLQQLDADVDVVEAGSFDEALDHAGEVPRLDLIVLDPTMPGMEWETIWFERLRMLRTRAPAAAIVIITASESPNDIRRALEVGVAGYIPKTANAGTISNALKLVLADEIYVPPALARRPPNAVGMPASGPAGADERSLTAPLTERQREVLAFLGEGKADKGIAGELGISERTVASHVGSILKRLGVANRTQAAIAMAEMRFAESISDQLQPAPTTFRYSLPRRRDPIAESSETSVPGRRSLASDADDPTGEELKRLRTSIH